MKIKIAALILLAIATPLVADVDYYKDLNTDDGTAILNTQLKFATNVPVNSQSDLLADLIDRASKNPKDLSVIKNVLSILFNLKDSEPRFVVTERLQKSLASQVNNPNSGVRSMLVNYLATKDAGNSRNTVLSFLNDNSEHVRQTTLSAIVKWKDAGTIYQDYISRHSGDDSFKQSIKEAKSLKASNQQILNQQSAN